VFATNAETPDTLRYQCSALSGMPGKINIVAKLSDTLQINGNNLIWNILTIQSDTTIDLDDVSFVAIAW
jgi:chromosome condensin MukBEF complex kleisin-like MukF subunit